MLQHLSINVFLYFPCRVQILDLKIRSQISGSFNCVHYIPRPLKPMMNLYNETFNYCENLIIMERYVWMKIVEICLSINLVSGF